MGPSGYHFYFFGSGDKGERVLGQITFKNKKGFNLFSADYKQRFDAATFEYLNVLKNFYNSSGQRLGNQRAKSAIWPQTRGT